MLLASGRELQVKWVLTMRPCHIVKTNEALFCGKKWATFKQCPSENNLIYAVN